MGHQQTVKIHSHIRTEVIRSSLKKGGPVAAIGALFILLSGSLLPVELLKIWGIPIFFVSIFLIGLGLYPYRKLSALQLRPHELHYDGLYFYFLQRGKPLFKIPKQNIIDIKYIEKEGIYGAGVRLKKPLTEKITIFQRKFNLEAYLVDSCSKYGVDLFFPFFSQKDIEMLNEDF